MNKISIVEDNTQVGKRVSALIERTPDLEFIKWYTSAESALEELPATDTEIIILDIGLPGMSGIDAIAKFKAKNSELKIIMFTVFEDEEIILAAIEQGANGYLLKDTIEELFLMEIKVVSLGGAPLTPRVAAKIIKEYQPKVLNADGKSKKENRENSNAVMELSVRECEVLTLISLGYSYADVAEDIDISIHTVRRHIESIYRKLDVHNKTQAIEMGRRLGILGD
ncbi:MAG: response regulator transcription factor [Leptospirales bacterium]